MADERGHALNMMGLAFVSGGLVGAAVTLLLAPQSGRETRTQMRGYTRRAEEKIRECADAATHVLDQATDRGREFIKDKQSVLAEAGRAAGQREPERPSAEKKA